MGKNKRKGGDAQGAGGKKVKTDIHKVGKYLPGGFPIDPKMKGVLVTCTRGKEHSAGQEACDLLAEVKTNNIQREKHECKSLQDLQQAFGIYMDIMVGRTENQMQYGSRDSSKSLLLHLIRIWVFLTKVVDLIYNSTLKRTRHALLQRQRSNHRKEGLCFNTTQGNDRQSIVSQA